jgi:tetratricopeptide (TPR) repeat protein
MVKKISLTVEEKILLHLFEYLKYRDQNWDVPFDVTQEGIASSVGIARCNVSRAMKKILEKDLIEERVAHVKGSERRRKVYFLTHQGLESVQHTKLYLENLMISFRDLDGNLKNMKLQEIKNYLDSKPTYIEILRHMSPAGIVDSKAIQTDIVHQYLDFTDQAPKLKYFFGRERELKTLMDWLGSHKMIIIRGIAGMGKTSLATKLMEELKPQMNIFWFRTHEWNSTRNILSHLSKFLLSMNRKKLSSYVDTHRKLDVTDISNILEPELQDANALLIFDDFQNLNKKILPLFSALIETLERVKGVTILILTRTHIPFYDHKDMAVKKIISEMELHGLDENSSLQLLRSRNIHFNNFDEIYSLTGGHPLSLELIDPNIITKDESISLTKDMDIKKYIHSEIFSQLASDEKTLLNIASVYRYPIPSKLFFIGEDISYNTIDNLVNKGLLIEEPSGFYAAHDFVKDFFYTRLPPKLREQYHSNASEHYVLEYERLKYLEEVQSAKTTEDAKQILDGDQWPSRGIHENEKLSIVEAQYHLLKAGDYQEAAILAIENGVELIGSGFLDEFLNILNQFDEKNTRPKKYITILIFKGDILTIQGEWQDAIKTYELALNLAKKLKDNYTVTQALRSIGGLHCKRSEWDEAVTNLNEALAISNKLKDNYGIANAHYWMGAVAARRGEYDKAINHYNKCMNYAKRINYKPGLAKTYTGMGDVYRDKGEYLKAIKSYNKSISILNEMGHLYEMSDVYNRIGITYCKQGGKEDQALQYYKKRIDISKKIGDIRGVGYGLSNAAECYTSKGSLDKALESCNKAMRIFAKTDERRMIANTLMVYGMIYGKHKEWDRAIEYFNRAIEISKDIVYPDMLAQSYFNFGFMYRDKGDKAKARNYLKEAIKLYKNLGNMIKVKKLSSELAKIK